MGASGPNCASRIGRPGRGYFAISPKTSKGKEVARDQPLMLSLRDGIF